MGSENFVKNLRWKLHTTLSTVACWIFMLSPLFAQNPPRTEVDPERLADEIFPIQNLDLNYEEFYDNLLQVLSNPIDLNRATGEELRALYVLREAQVESLLAFRRANGPFLSLYELQSIPDFDSATVHRLLPFVKVEDATTTFDRSLLRRIGNEKNSYLITRFENTLEKKKGYRDRKSTRLNSSHERLSRMPSSA